MAGQKDFQAEEIIECAKTLGSFTFSWVAQRMLGAAGSLQIASGSKYLTQREVAEELKVSEKTVMRWREDPEKNFPKPYCPDGRTLYFVRGEIERWIERFSRE